jgi:hypothetical protein
MRLLPTQAGVPVLLEALALSYEARDFGLLGLDPLEERSEKHRTQTKTIRVSLRQ